MREGYTRPLHLHHGNETSERKGCALEKERSAVTLARPRAQRARIEVRHALLAVLAEPADDTLPLGAGLAHLANVPVMCGDVR